MIAIKHSSASNICLLTPKGPTVTDPLHISTIWNDNFSSVTEKLKPISNFQINHFKIIFIILIESRYSKQRQMAHEVNLIIYSLNSDKSTGSNRFPTKILKLLKKWDFYSSSRYIWSVFLIICMWYFCWPSEGFLCCGS